MDWETFDNGLISGRAGGQPPSFVMQKKEPGLPHFLLNLCLA